ncbi:Ankyrin repeat domain-containing protein 11 [Folsomia candida]|uniref:Ankyrin repeat domain-containing protein 11 n=1 Tax=Folsomia candida TaxID=158441 RepID=A0A226E1T4_FOLCA|nr:Ankyrin repeat domain-containing protein 11 [Folsomia candida]
MAEVGQLSSVKNDDHKLEAFSLPESEGPPQDSNRLKRVSSFTADPQSIFKEERIRLHKTSQEIELEEEEIAQLVEQELKAVEEKKKKKWMYFIEMIAAKADVFATAHTMPKHQVCIYVAFAMIPMSILTITWDLIATWVFQIPHLSTISAPGFILVINFVAMPLAMYGYMMEYLMYENSREAILGMICVGEE